MYVSCRIQEELIQATFSPRCTHPQSDWRCSDLFSNPDLRTPSWGPLLPSSEHDATMVYLSRTACFRFYKRCLATQTGCGMRHSSCTSANLACDQDISTRSGFLSVSKIGKDSIRLEPMKTIGSTDEVARENQGTMDPVQLESRALVPRCPHLTLWRSSSRPQELPDMLCMTSQSQCIILLALPSV